MLSLHKKIIPLQKRQQGLAFNIQSLDTIKYTEREFPTEMETAVKSIVIDPGKTEKQKVGIIPQSVLTYLGLNGINWPQITKGSDVEYALTLGIDLGFFLFIDFINYGYCYLRVIKNDEEEDKIILFLKTLLKRISPLHINIKRQIEELEDLSPIHAHSSFIPEQSSLHPDDLKRVRYLKSLIDLINDSKIFIYRDCYRNREKILKKYGEIEIQMELPELVLIDDDGIEEFLNKHI